MAAPKYDTTLDRGVTFHRVVTLKTDDTTAYDLTDCTVASQLRTSLNSPQVSGEFTCTIDDDPVTGRFFMDMTVANTLKLEAGQYTFDIILTLANLEKKKIAQGTITVINTCTR